MSRVVDQNSLGVGIKLKEVATAEAVHRECTVLHSDPIGLVFEIQRTINEGGTIETVVSQMLVPWGQIKHIVVAEEVV